MCGPGGVPMKIPSPLRAITLWPEWAYAVRHLGKRIENRGRVAPFKKGELIAIHAGVKPMTGPRLYDVVEMAVLAGWRLDHDGGDTQGIWLERDGEYQCVSHERITTGAIIALAEFGGTFIGSSFPWSAPGQKHWRLSSVMPVPEPVPCRGKQGPWRVPEEQAKNLRNQFRYHIPAMDIYAGSVELLEEQAEVDRLVSKAVENAR